uniref:Acetolactate synthase small subunit n=1 Tax=Fervidicoccus fontis TaxID=683846 RepID=A0A7J3ZLJ8_9CREN
MTLREVGEVEPVVIIAIVEDRPGVLYKVSSIIRRAGVNIDAITVARTVEDGVSRMTFLINTTRGKAEYLARQIEKVPTVIAVGWHLLKDVHSLEVMLARISLGDDRHDRRELALLAKTLSLKILEETANNMVVAAVGSPEEVERVIELLMSKFKILDLARSGPTALTEVGRAWPESF